jgi:hypothetical protein
MNVQSPPSVSAPDGLAALEARLRRDLRDLCHPPAN